MPPLDDATRFPRARARDHGLRRGARRRWARRSRAAACPATAPTTTAWRPPTRRSSSAVAVNATKAIAAYVRQLRCGAGRFDQWLDGDETALSRAEQRGAALFVGPRRLRVVPLGPAPDRRRVPQRRPGAGDRRRRDPGRRRPRRRDGHRRRARRSDEHGGRAQRRRSPRAARAAVTPQLEGAFRTPTLRCVAVAPELHAHGRSWRRSIRSSRSSTAAAIARATTRARTSSRRSGSRDRERADLVAFMDALAGPGPAVDAADGAAMTSTRPSAARSLLSIAACSGTKAQTGGGAGAAGVTGAGGSDGGTTTDGPALPEVAVRGPRRPDGDVRPQAGHVRLRRAGLLRDLRDGAGHAAAAAPASSIPRAGASCAASRRTARTPTTCSASGPRSSAQCRAGLSNTRVLPDDGRPRVRSHRRRSRRATRSRPPPSRTTASRPIASASRSTSRAAPGRSSSTWISPTTASAAGPRSSSPRTRRPRPASTGRSAARARATASRSSSAPAGATRRTRSRRSSTRSTTTCRRRTSRRSTARSRTRRRRPTRSTTSRST